MANFPDSTTNSPTLDLNWDESTLFFGGHNIPVQSSALRHAFLQTSQFQLGTPPGSTLSIVFPSAQLHEPLPVISQTSHVSGSEDSEAPSLIKASKFRLAAKSVLLTYPKRFLEKEKFANLNTVLDSYF
jgi:hypothetical protein